MNRKPSSNPYGEDPVTSCLRSEEDKRDGKGKDVRRKRREGERRVSKSRRYYYSETVWASCV